MSQPTPVENMRNTPMYDTPTETPDPARYVDVTEEHIQNAGICTSTCPIARCLNANTDSYYISAATRNSVIFENRSYTVGPKLSKVIKTYDQLSTMEPVRLKLTRDTQLPSGRYSSIGYIEVA